MGSKLVRLLIVGEQKNLRRVIPKGNKLQLHLAAWGFISDQIPDNCQMQETNFEFMSHLINDTLSTIYESLAVQISNLNDHEISKMVNCEPIKGLLERACVPMRDESLTSMRKAMNAESN